MTAADVDPLTVRYLVDQKVAEHHQAALKAQAGNRAKGRWWRAWLGW